MLIALFTGIMATPESDSPGQHHVLLVDAQSLFKSSPLDAKSVEEKFQFIEKQNREESRPITFHFHAAPSDPADWAKLAELLGLGDVEKYQEAFIDTPKGDLLARGMWYSVRDDAIVLKVCAHEDLGLLPVYTIESDEEVIADMIRAEGIDPDALRARRSVNVLRFPSTFKGVCVDVTSMPDGKWHTTLRFNVEHRQATAVFAVLLTIGSLCPTNSKHFEVLQRSSSGSAERFGALAASEYREFPECLRHIYETHTTARKKALREALTKPPSPEELEKNQKKYDLAMQTISRSAELLEQLKSEDKIDQSKWTLVHADGELMEAPTRKQLENSAANAGIRGYAINAPASFDQCLPPVLIVGFHDVLVGKKGGHQPRVLVMIHHGRNVMEKDFIFDTGCSPHFTLSALTLRQLGVDPVATSLKAGTPIVQHDTPVELIIGGLETEELIGNNVNAKPSQSHHDADIIGWPLIQKAHGMRFGAGSDYLDNVLVFRKVDGLFAYVPAL